MRDFSFSTPTKIHFGETANRNVAEELKKDNIKKVLVVFGGNSQNLTMEKLYIDILGQLELNDIESVVLRGITPNPTLEQAQSGITFARGEQVDAVLAIGGGSVIDTAKCIAAGVLHGGDIWDVYMGRERLKRALPVYVVLTLSGTGSENNGNSVISDKGHGVKKLLVSNELYPKTAFINPTVQETVPPQVFAACCMDAMCHIMEFYFDGGEALEVSDQMAEALLRTMIKEVPQVLQHPEDWKARASVMWAASLALNGVPSIVGLGGKGGDWSSHNLETGLSILKNTTHGTGLGILFPAWMEYVKDSCEAKMARFARNVFDVSEENDARAAEKGIRKLKAFFVSIGCPASLEELRVQESELEKIADIISVFLPMGRVKRLKNLDVAKILQCAY